MKWIRFYKSGKVEREHAVAKITKYWKLRNEIIKQKYDK